MEKTANNRCQTQSLFFGKLFVLFYYFRFVLMEKTRSPSPRLRLAAKRWQQLVPKKPDKYWQKFFLDFFLIAQSKDCFGLAFG